MLSPAAAVAARNLQSKGAFRNAQGWEWDADRRLFSAPDGAQWKWDRPDEPNDEDLGAIMASHKPQRQGPVLSPEMARQTRMQGPSLLGPPASYPKGRYLPLKPFETPEDIRPVQPLPDEGMAAYTARIMAEGGAKDREAIAKAASSLNIPIPGTNRYVPTGDIIGGIVGAPIHVAESLGVIGHPDRSIQDKAGAAANIVLEAAGGAIAGKVLKVLSPVLRQQFTAALQGKNVAALKRVFIDAQKEGVDIAKAFGIEKPLGQARMPIQPRTVEMGTSGRREPKPPPQAPPAKTSNPKKAVETPKAGKDVHAGALTSDERALFEKRMAEWRDAPKSTRVKSGGESLGIGDIKFGSETEPNINIAAHEFAHVFDEVTTRGRSADFLSDEIWKLAEGTGRGGHRQILVDAPGVTQSGKLMIADGNGSELLTRSYAMMVEFPGMVEKYAPKVAEAVNNAAKRANVPTPADANAIMVGKAVPKRGANSSGVARGQDTSGVLGTKRVADSGDIETTGANVSQSTPTPPITPKAVETPKAGGELLGTDEELVRFLIKNDPVSAAKRLGYDIHAIRANNAIYGGDYKRGFRYRIGEHPNLTLAKNEKDVSAFLERERAPTPPITPKAETPAASRITQALEGASAQRQSAFEAMQAARAKAARAVKSKGKQLGAVQQPILKEEIDYAKAWLKEKGLTAAKAGEDFIKHVVELGEEAVHWRRIVSQLAKAEPEAPSIPRTFTTPYGAKVVLKGEISARNVSQAPPAKGSGAGNVSKAEGGIQEGQRAANASANALRESQGLPSLRSAKPESTQQWFDEAGKRNYPARAYQMAQDILHGKQKRLDDVQSAGMATRLDELDAEFQSVNPSDSIRLQQIVDEVDAITQATRKAGTEWGREGVARKTWFKSDYSEGGLLRRFTAEGGGTKEAQAAKTLGKNIAQGEQIVSRMKSEAGFYTTRGQRIKGDIRQARAEAISRIKSNWASMNRTIPKNKQAGGINLDSAALAKIKDDVLILVKSYIQEGAVSLGDVVPKLRSFLKENEIDLDDDSIHRILAGEYEKSTKTLSAEAKILQDLRKEAKSTTGAQRAILERRIREQEARIRTLPGRPAQTKVKFDKSLRDMEIELMARKVEADNLAAELRRIRLAKQTHPGIRAYHEIADITRSVVASSDLSAPLNQGAFALAGHPLASAKAAKDMMRALRSEGEMNKLIAGTRLSKHYNEAVTAGLEVHGTRLGKGEEFFTSQIVNNPVTIRGFDINPISYSERAYTAYLNKLRMDMFSNLVESQEKSRLFGMMKAKKLSIDELKQTAEYVNTVTGVGTGKIAQGLKTINREFPALFAPGYMISRWKTALGTPLLNAAIRKNPRLATAILKDYAAFAGMVGGTLYAADKAGFSVDLSYENFGKIGAGNTDVDPFGAIFGPLRFLAKVKKSPNQAPIAAGYYLFGKASPVGRTGWDLLKGTNYDKDPVGFAAWDEAWNLAKGALPITVQQQMELSDAEGLTDDQKKALRLLSIIGLNLNVKDQPAKGR